MSSELCPIYSSFFGFAGVCASMVFSCLGAGYGTALAGRGIAAVGAFRPEIVMKSLIPVVMSGIIGVYGLVMSVLIAGDMSPDSDYSLFSGFIHLSAGLAVGLTGVAAGYAIGIVGDKGVQSFMRQDRIFVSMVLILIFAEVLGLYGLIVGLILQTKVSNVCY
ncbi:V-type ATPase V0 proteolipid subunit [Schizosaccharomyces octosporus yFS286]|uniref:V-type proton ATPase proteolipid subunit n=1 Tax=Schizosaccharomyces octosporus (strain yFS286) TaxID=483514 RepID=S9PRH5_SCHOY|nr:V-type ATPase V0 proteolipid subunit [Schizosaccharomyces octosporus yFS286]EPX70567.1 V-type ATPase V0 proteolipid subunit [Schizosaccharomyces octosporus yFS286]